jgi:uncharacterized protein (UPF0335 family)
MVEQLKDNTDVNKLRRRLVDIDLAFEESMMREIVRVKQEFTDLHNEIKEGMSNRGGSGFQPNEARKYSNKMVNSILRDSLQDLESIKKDLMVDIGTLVGEEFASTLGESNKISGIIGNAIIKNYEQSALSVKVLTPPE